MAIDSKIRARIKETGYIKIDDLMREVSQIHQSSYYRAKKEIGIRGDFITAPEISQLFGETIGLWLITKWQELGCPEDFAIVELGPGNGTLMHDLLRTAQLVPKLAESAEILLLEINQHFIKKQQEKLEPLSTKINWIKTINQLPPKPCIVISNEFFDSLPIQQYIRLKHRWYELTVVCNPIDYNLRFDKIELHKALAHHLTLEHKHANDGATIEESRDSLEITRQIATHINKFDGACLTIDYGYDIEPANRTRHQYHSTLQAVKNHWYHPVLESLGAADLSAHVDFNALKNAAIQKGIKNITTISQAKFLADYGINQRHEQLQKTASPEDAAVLDKQLHRLIDKRQMGELFKVMEYVSIT